MKIKEPKYNIGDRVYHVTKDSDEGVVINATYSLRNCEWTYSVTFMPLDGGVQMYENELSESKYF